MTEPLPLARTGARGFHALFWPYGQGHFTLAALRTALALLALGADRGPAWLALVFACATAPTLLLAGWAGWAADAFPKRRVMIVARFVEAAALGLAGLALLGHPFLSLLLVLLAVSVQGAFFTPAALGLVPELWPERRISRIQGLLETGAFLSLLAGTAMAGWLYAWYKGDLSGMGLLLLPLPLLGALLLFLLPARPAAQSEAAFTLDPFREAWRGLRTLARDRSLRVAALGRAYFYLVGTLAQMALLAWARAGLGLSGQASGVLLACLTLGVGLGSLAAARLSGDKVELGLVPPGALLAGLALLGLPLTNAAPLQALLLVLSGFGGGLYLVPLTSLLLQKSPERARGRLAAASSLLNTVAVLTAAGLLWLALGVAGIGAETVLLFTGLFTLLALAYLLLRVPALLIRFTFWVVTHTLYRTRVRGSEHLPFRGPVVLVANHVSHIDGLLVGACVQRFIRFTVAQPEYQVPGLRWLWRLMKAIPIGEKGEASWGESVARLRAELKEGHTVCLFAEGAISRTGNLLPFKPTLKAVLEGMPEVPVIPVSIDGLWGSLFAYSGGRFAWQWPARFPNPVWISFGAPLAPGFKPEEARQAILGLSAEAARLRIRKDDLLHWQFIRTACRLRLNFFMSDSSGRELRFYKGLTTALALSRWVRRHCADQRMVGLLLPPSVPGALMNYAVMIAGKIPINLNYTIGKDAMAHAVKQCGIRTVLTTPLLLEKLAIERTPEMVYMEELAPQLGTLDKLPALLASLLLPHRLIRALYAPEQTDPEELATIIFSSGSTGVPKGVMLSHRNILSNIRGAEQVIWITPEDRILGILPFFHSFGFTIILWFPAVAGFGVAFHPVPTDAKAIGELCQKYDVSIMVSTPTFYGHYIRKCEPEQFHKLRFAVAGAEKLRQATATAFREKFGQDLYEGYGCTELSPVVAVNVPDHLEGAKRQVGLKPGSVGHPLPGVTARVIDPDTGAELGTGQQGMIEVKGPNLMMGYLNAPEKTAEVVRKGWYLTGDIGWMDEDGFLHLTDRLFRFSKIGGEMVPHIRVEEVLQAAWPEEGFGVTAVPDEAKGERLVVLYTNPERRPDELKAALESSALPKLWIPKTYYPVEAIPVLGTGKTDLREMKRVALQRAGMLVD